MERTTSAMLMLAFNALMRTAERLGFDTQGWSVMGAPWELVRVEYVATEGSDTLSRCISSTEFPRSLGATKRDACNTLTTYTAALHAVELQRQANSHTLAQRYPGDLWRWNVGSAYGRPYCELYRIPRDGSADHVTYGHKVDCKSEKNAREVCGQLNESLHMGGMLGDKPEWW